jgi:hypothetical protein
MTCKRCNDTGIEALGTPYDAPTKCDCKGNIQGGEGDEQSPINVSGIVHTFIGLAISGPFSATCPCGVRAELDIHAVPHDDIPFPCGNPDHWLVKHYQKVTK